MVIAWAFLERANSAIFLASVFGVNQTPFRLVRCVQRRIIGANDDRNIDEIIRVDLLDDMLLRHSERCCDIPCRFEITDAIDDKRARYTECLVIFHFHNIKPVAPEVVREFCAYAPCAASIQHIKLNDALGTGRRLLRFVGGVPPADNRIAKISTDGEKRNNDNVDDELF